MSVRDLTILGCSSQQPTRFRNHGAYLFRWNEEGLLFDPGEGTQRQFIFANVAPTVVTRIFISHFHGDHCLGLGSFLMRLNLDKISHPVHCYYPASGKKYFDRLRYGTIYHDTVRVIEHPVAANGIVHDDGKFRIEARFLDHGVDNVGWRITEPDSRKYDPTALERFGIRGMQIRKLIQQGYLELDDKKVVLDQVSHIRPGDSIAVVIDTRYCQNALELAKKAKMLLCESTYLEEHRELAYNHYHLTAKGAAAIAKEAQAHTLILTHYSARYLNAKNFENEAKEVFPHVFAAEDLCVFPFPKED
jgi:ribonuclease Z